MFQDLGEERFRAGFRRALSGCAEIFCEGLVRIVQDICLVSNRCL